MNLKKRIKTYKFWVALSSAVVILAKSLGEAFGFEVSQEIIDNIIMGFCGVLVVIGIVDKPGASEEKTTQPFHPK